MAMNSGKRGSVYLILRPLLIVCKVLGMCAIEGLLSRTAGGLGYRGCGAWVYYCVMFHVAISIMMHATLQLRRQSWPVTLFYDLRKWCFLVALLSTDGQRVSLLHGLELFDSAVYRLNHNALLAYDPYKRSRFWQLVYHLVYTVGNNVVSYTLFYPRNKPVLGFIFDFLVKTFAAQMVFCYTVINIVFNDELCHRFKLLKLSWKHHVHDPCVSTANLERVRLLHADLTALAELLSRAFGRFFIVNLFFVFLETLMYLYRTMLTNTNVFSNVQSVFFLAVNVASVPLLATSYHLSLSGKTILNELRTLPIASHPRAYGEQVILFVKQLHRDPITVSACGFFPIDRQLIVSDFSSEEIEREMIKLDCSKGAGPDKIPRLVLQRYVGTSFGGLFQCDITTH